MLSSLLLQLLLTLGISALFLSLDLYAFKALKSHKISNRTYWSPLFWGFSVTIVLAFSLSTLWANEPGLPYRIHSYLLGLIVLKYLPTTVYCLFLLGEDIYRLFKWLGQLVQTGRKANPTPAIDSRRKFISQVGLLTAGVPFASAVHGVTWGSIISKSTKKYFFSIIYPLNLTEFL